MALFEFMLQKCNTISQIKQLQAHMLTTGLFQNSFARTKLVEFCAVSPAGSLNYAGEIFRHIQNPAVNDWNALIRGFAQSSVPRNAILTFVDMRRHGLKPDALTCSFALKACARVLAVQEGVEIHTVLVRLGFHADVLLMTTLVDLYGKSGDLNCARQVFDEMPFRDAAAWNVLIAGFAQGSRAREAVELFQSMRLAQVEPNEVTVLGVMSACSQLGALRTGESVHYYVREKRLDRNVFVCNALIDMYAKCGRVDKACQVFDGMPTRSLVSWNAMIMGLALHGHGAEALALFPRMEKVNVKSDEVTFLAALYACNHAGLVDDGLHVFHDMVGSSILPNVKHYGCMVDLLGRAGRLDEAYRLISTMPIEPDVVLWQSLLGACKTYGNVELAERAMQKLVDMGSDGSGDYVLMSNLYASHERWEDVKKVRQAMKTRDVKKIPGFSFIEVEGVVHKFVNGDKRHSRWREISQKLDEIVARARELGYMPETCNVLHDIGEEEKRDALSYHSEKLAIAFGLISTCGATPIHVNKNIRICGDCHAITKFISKIYNREVIVRDRARFHKFKEGLCSCGDYW